MWWWILTDALYGRDFEIKYQRPTQEACTRRGVFFTFFVCLFVCIKPENPYFASHGGLKVNPLGVHPPG